MDYEQFLNKVREELMDSFPGMQLEIRTVNKLQGGSYRGIAFMPGDNGPGAVLNMQAPFEALQKGMPMASVMKGISEEVRRTMRERPSVDVRVLQDYDQMKKTLVMQAVSTEKNREMLEGVPHREMEDISIVYRFQVGRRGRSESTVLVTNKLLEHYGISAEQLIKDAEQNAPQRNPITIRSMGEVLEELSGGLFSRDEVGVPPLLVATVAGGVNGAGVLGYPDFFREAAEKAGGSYFILPSSIHEVLLVPESAAMTAREFNAMISEINGSEVSPEEQLSDVAYHYDAEAQLFEKAADYEARVVEEREVMYADQMPGAAGHEEKMTVLMVDPNCYPVKAKIGTDLESLQAAVGGNIEVIYPFEDTVGLIMNEDGKIDGYPLNRALRDENGQVLDAIAGSFMVVGLTDESFCSLTPDQMQKYEAVFHQPEVFVKMGRGLKVFPLPDEMAQKLDTAERTAGGPEKAAAAPEKKVKKAEHDGR